LLSIENDLDDKIKKINEDISKSYYEDLFKDVYEIYNYLNKFESALGLYLSVVELKNKEYEILSNALENRKNNKIVAYLEGNIKAWKLRQEILSLLKKYNASVVYLDEGNSRYERLLDEKGNFLKSVEEIQIGREDFWIKKIKENPNYDFSIAIVGKKHVIPNSKPFIGYFAQKIRELGYNVYIEML
ncbi:MAG: hypothetical protein ACP5F8_01560, partial [Candidatus Aenigmatarchaeota archaeon]